MVEVIQYFQIFNNLTRDNYVLKIILGATFDVKDIICYIIGYLIIKGMNLTMEYLDILDENGNKTGEKDTRENIHKLGLLHSEVAAFIYTDTGEILLQKRKSNKATYAGVWSVTGGHVLTGENNEAAIIREIKEELNLEIKNEKITFVTTYKSKKVKDDIINNKFFNIYNVEIDESQFKKIKIQKEEIEDIKLFSIEEIENILNSEDKHYKFPQKSELAIMIIKEKMTKN